MQSQWSIAAPLTGTILLSTLAAFASNSAMAAGTIAEHPMQAVLDLTADELAARYKPVTSYTIRRKGKRIGSHILKFQPQADGFNVFVESNIKVTVLKVPVFRFRYQGSETWSSGELVEATGITVENSERSEVSLQSSATNSLLQELMVISRYDD